MDGERGNELKTIPSIETQQHMHAFFMKTSAPRIYKKQLEEEQKRKEMESQNKIRIKKSNKNKHLLRQVFIGGGKIKRNGILFPILLEHLYKHAHQKH